MKLERMVYLNDINNQLQRRSIKILIYEYFYNNFCERKTFKIKESQKPTGKLDWGSVYKRNHSLVNETSAKDLETLQSLKTHKECYH